MTHASIAHPRAPDVLGPGVPHRYGESLKYPPTAEERKGWELRRLFVAARHAARNCRQAFKAHGPDSPRGRAAWDENQRAVAALKSAIAS